MSMMIIPLPKETKFKLGQILLTDGVSNIIQEFQCSTLISNLIARHCACDWGDLCDSDKFLNDRSLFSGDRLFSAYNTPRGRIYIITECDRQSTTVLLSEEY